MSVGCYVCGELAAGYFALGDHAYPFCGAHMPSPSDTLLPTATEGGNLGESESDDGEDNGNGDADDHPGA